MNAVHLIGRIASDVELRQTNSGKDVANLRLAVNRVGSEDADFFDIVVWNGTAKATAEYVGKGDEIAVEGQLRLRSWETDEGQKRSRVEVHARSVTFLRKKGSGNGAKPAETQAPAPTDDDIPF